MPIKPVPPREGRSPYWRGRGTHFGISVDRSTRARERRLAVKIIRNWEREIERGATAPAQEPAALTFAAAALAYMKAGGERRFLTPLLKHFAETTVAAIDQAAIDAAADALLPDASAATRNRQIYTPTAAVLHRAGIKLDVKRPKGAQGRSLAGWLWPEQAGSLIGACDALDLEFGIFCDTLLYTGMRLSEGLGLELDRVRLDEAFAYLRDSKNGEARAIYLPPYLVERIRAHPRGLDRTGRLFRFHKSGHLYELLRTAAKQAGIALPARQAFHIFCHTYGTWMRRYGGLDQRGLLGTGRWKDIKSTVRYTHVVVSEDAARAALLPVPKRVEG